MAQKLLTDEEKMNALYATLSRTEICSATMNFHFQCWYCQSNLYRQHGLTYYRITTPTTPLVDPFARVVPEVQAPIVSRGPTVERVEPGLSVELDRDISLVLSMNLDLQMLSNKVSQTEIENEFNFCPLLTYPRVWIYVFKGLLYFQTKSFEWYRTSLSFKGWDGTTCQAFYDQKKTEFYVYDSLWVRRTSLFLLDHETRMQVTNPFTKESANVFMHEFVRYGEVDDWTVWTERKNSKGVMLIAKKRGKSFKWYPRSQVRIRLILGGPTLEYSFLARSHLNQSTLVYLEAKVDNPMPICVFAYDNKKWVQVYEVGKKNTSEVNFLHKVLAALSGCAMDDAYQASMQQKRSYFLEKGQSYLREEIKEIYKATGVSREPTEDEKWFEKNRDKKVNTTSGLVREAVHQRLYIASRMQRKKAFHGEDKDTWTKGVTKKKAISMALAKRLALRCRMHCIDLNPLFLFGIETVIPKSCKCEEQCNCRIQYKLENRVYVSSGENQHQQIDAIITLLVNKLILRRNLGYKQTYVDKYILYYGDDCIGRLKQDYTLGTALKVSEAPAHWESQGMKDGEFIRTLDNPECLAEARAYVDSFPLEARAHFLGYRITGLNERATGRLDFNVLPNFIGVQDPLVTFERNEQERKRQMLQKIDET